MFVGTGEGDTCTYLHINGREKGEIRIKFGTGCVFFVILNGPDNYTAATIYYQANVSG